MYSFKKCYFTLHLVNIKMNALLYFYLFFVKRHALMSCLQTVNYI